ncbi:rhamnan synthesis F family protein [Leisingera daeponensis]|uniref:rhamnan synthesis F family protein n=1 Tax=Leisingera daeponensis TaxID=405746 RepID=UPI001C9425CE|nr:rhamnan synthesis F family protein [Leisingera daeponensis]MBY6057026.1 rhamnan synthesis F family protein [Leisingera daeponensis]
MKLPPLWKITRELKRPLAQLKLLPSRIGTYVFGNKYYDWFLAKNSRCTEGRAAPGSRIAVYLIFPSQGVLASHIEALKYLISSGYAPLVVSNLPLPEADRDQVLDFCWLCLERPNYGYDFGGYRDGILLAREKAAQIDRLVLLNDSSWFPLPGAQDWLAEAEKTGLDFTGAVSNYGHPRVDPENFRSIRWNYTTSHRNFHYCSFALMMSGRLMADPQFIKFWERFQLTSDKKVTVRRGEIGLSQWITSSGYSHGMTSDPSDLDQRLAGLSHKEIKAAVRGAVFLDRPRLDTLREQLLAADAPAGDLVAFLLTAVAIQGASYVQPDLMRQLHGAAFLKKSPCWLDEKGSAITIRFARRLGGDFGAVVAREAETLRREKAPDFPPV